MASASATRIEGTWRGVTGTVTRGTAGIVGRVVWLHRTDRPDAQAVGLHTDESGRFAIEAELGSYRLEVELPEPWEPYASWFSRASTLRSAHTRQFDLTSTMARADFAIELPDHDVHVECRFESTGTALCDAYVWLEQEGPEPVARFVRTGADGVATFQDCRPGSWRAHVWSRFALPVEPRTVDVADGVATTRLSLPVQPAGCVVVRLATPDGNSVGTWHPSVLRLRGPDGVVRRSWVPRASIVSAPDKVCFEQVPPGMHLLCCDDEVDVAGRVRFAPCEPVLPAPVEVRCAVETTVTIVGAPRPWLSLFIDDDRTLDPAVEVRVVGPSGPVAPGVDAPPPWSGHVLAGPHEVAVLRHGAVVHTETIHVALPGCWHRLRTD
ncbi:MAG: carboxypeptidase regulatory-like domain-containing protein [Planctomycetes bacterium]|nr:carboxypeptidase regulatory-like domain-containing protein [Planctomycetota bacterium]